MKSDRLHRRLYKVKGPNHIWHVDGNDKLKPYGFAIHGCMDGFSRKLIWLTVDTTNKQPELVLRHYITAVEREVLVPIILRCDRGTENFLVGDIQMLLLSDHADDLASVGSM